MLTRPGSHADIPAVLRILAASASAPQWTAADFLHILQSVDEYLLRCLVVAEEAGTLLGFAVTSVLTAVYPPTAEVESIAVLPASRGRGVGRTLLERAAAWAAGKGAESLLLEVRAGNESALRLYLLAGFTRTGVRAGYYTQPLEDAVLMERPLSRSA